MTIQFEPLTKKQENYIELLVIDLSMLRSERNFYMSRIAGREIKNIDQLSKSEASQVISKWREWKNSKRILHGPPDLEDDFEFYDELNNLEF